MVSKRMATLLGTARSSMPVRSFLSSRSFWKFSIFIMVPWSCSTISEMSAREAAVANRGAVFFLWFRFGDRKLSHMQNYLRVTDSFLQ